MTAFIKAGTGINVDYDFTRLITDTPCEIEMTRQCYPHQAWVTFAGDANAQLGFMRQKKIRVLVERKYLGGLES